MGTTVGYVLGVLLCYLAGSVPFGYLIGRLGGIDIRRWGSGNVGAANVARILGVRRGAVVLVLDMLKGAAAVGLVAHGFLGLVPEGQHVLFLVLCAAAVVLGHTFTCWLRFQGGKGAATALGAWLVIAPLEALIALAVWLVVVGIWRYVSLASIIAAVALPSALVLLNYGRLGGDVLPKLVFSGLLGVLVIARHHGNIARLVKGTENKIGQSFAKVVRVPKPDDSS